MNFFKDFIVVDDTVEGEAMVDYIVVDYIIVGYIVVEFCSRLN